MKDINECLGLPLIALDNSDELGLVTHFLTDPVEGHVIGLAASSNDWFMEPRVVLFDDVVAFGPNALMVREAATVRPISTVPEIRAFLDCGEEKRIRRAVSFDGRNLGTIIDWAFDEGSAEVVRYRVDPPGGEDSQWVSHAAFVRSGKAVVILRIDGESPASGTGGASRNVGGGSSSARGAPAAPRADPSAAARAHEAGLQSIAAAPTAMAGTPPVAPPEEESPARARELAAASAGAGPSITVSPEPEAAATAEVASPALVPEADFDEIAVPSKPSDGPAREEPRHHDSEPASEPVSEVVPNRAADSGPSVAHAPEPITEPIADPAPALEEETAALEAPSWRTTDGPTTPGADAGSDSDRPVADQLKEAINRNEELMVPLVVGKYADREILDTNGARIVARGQLITPEVAASARRSWKLYDLWIAAQSTPPAEV